MKDVQFCFRKQLSRRTLLKGAGVGLGLPFLEAMSPAFAAASAGPRAKRFVGVSMALGLHGPHWIPEGKGTDYKASRYLKPLQDIRNDFTVVSGSSHPGVTGGHTAEGSIFSACPNVRGATARNTVSVDQLMAKHLGHETRFPSLVLGAGGNSSSPCYTENGSMIPALTDPVALFTQLFVDNKPAEQERQAELIRRGRSVMDVVGAEAKVLQRELGAGDRDKLDSWFTSVRELEKRLAANQAWVHQPKPKVDATPPKQYNRDNVCEVEEIMLEIVQLALQTDSTRFVILHLGNQKIRGLEGVDEGYHGLSHHGRDDEKIRQLAIVEQIIVNAWGDFLRKLKASEQANNSLLDETMVMLTSNLGNASSHDTRNMPVLFGGGGFKHGRHLAFDRKNNYPLPNLYLSALQQLGLEFDQFATSTGSMTGLV